MSQKWLFLDFDNTLMGTEHLALPSLIARFNVLYEKEIDHPLTLAEFKTHFHGQGREILCENLSRYFGITVDNATLYENREGYIMRTLKTTKVEMAPHLIPALEALEVLGYKFVFVSNNPIQRALTSMRFATNGQGARLAQFFGTYFFESGSLQKPHPEVYLRAMEQLEISPEDAFAVEDSLTGLKAAKEAKIRTFGYVHFADAPSETAQKLQDAGALACFSDWAEFPQVLKKHGG